MAYSRTASWESKVLCTHNWRSASATDGTDTRGVAQSLEVCTGCTFPPGSQRQRTDVRGQCHAPSELGKE